MLQSKTLFTAVFLIVMIAVLLVLYAVGFFAPGMVTPESTPPDLRSEQVQPVEVQSKASVPVPAPTELEAAQAITQPDGASILEDHCVQCHASQWLVQVNKSGSEWEKTLAKMETMGVHLEASEKDSLLNYLATADQP
jgi:cytochrome c5